MNNSNEILPLARIVARELSAEEMLEVSGGYPSCTTCGGNGGDGTTTGPKATDVDHQQ